MELISNQQINKLLSGKHLKKVSEAYDANKSISVSVFCLTFNQEKYIRDALDSFLMQLVDFNVEIVVHDDASTDSTPIILDEYAAKYPHIIKIFKEKENLYSKIGDTIGIERLLIKKIKGDYVASCEGDDYWTDPYKLYLQKNMLDSFDNINYCTHKVFKMDLINNANNCFIPERHLDSCVLTECELANFVNLGYPFQTSSYFMRKVFYQRFLEEYPKFAQIIPTSDESIMYYYCNNGGCVYLDREMSCWRQFTENSWNVNLLHSTSKEQNERRRKLASGIMSFYDYSGKRFHSCIDRANRFMIVTYISENNLKQIFKEKSMRKTLKKQGIINYYKLRIKAFLQKNEKKN